MYPPVFLITLLTPYCMVDHYGRTNDECTQVCYCSHYLNVVSHITMSDLMMDGHTYVTDNTTYTMLCQISISDLMRNVHTCFTDNTMCAIFNRTFPTLSYNVCIT